MDISPVVVLDFETTGLSPDYGDRAIEIGAVVVEDNEITDNFQSLMNPGFKISSFIQAYTGISNSMISAAPHCEEVMEQFAEFIGDHPLVAHNASFDKRFLDSEFRFIDRKRNNPMACSMLVARRIFPDAVNHKLGTLVHYCRIDNDGTFHRALADAEMTGRLWLSMMDTIRADFAVSDISFELMRKLSRVPKASVAAFLEKEAGSSAQK